MNMKKIFTLFITILSFNGFSQTTTLYSDDFESTSLFAFQYYPVSSANTWRINSCAGSSITGVNALYVSKGGVNPGCGVNGADQYAFAPALPSTQERIISYVSIDGTCTNSHMVSFDYKLNLTNSNNKAVIVYSLDGSFWYVQDTLPNSTGWTNATIPLSVNTNNVNFFVGVRFEYDSGAESGDPLAIDNFKIEGKNSIANIVEDTLAVCGQSTILVNADEYFAGTGTWTIVSQASPTTSLTQLNSHQTALNNLGFGTTVLAWTVVSGTCGTSYDTITIINSQAPSNANVQDTLYACAVSQLNISTSAPSSGTGMWSSNQGVTFANANSPATVATTLPDGWVNIIWTVSSPGCPSKADTMHVFKTGGQKIVTKDTTICFSDDNSLLVVATPTDSMQTTNWLFLTGNGDLTPLSSDSIQVSNLQIGENTLIYQVSHKLCPKEADTLRITITPCEDFEPVFPTVITPNGDGKNDLFVVQNLEKIYLNCQMTIYNRYGSVVFESTGYTTPWDGTFKGEKLPMGTYYFKLELNDASNKVYKGPISVIH